MSSNTHKVIEQYNYIRSSDQDASSPTRHPVVVVGAGPVGLVAAIDLAQRDIPVVLLDDNDRIGEGSRAICFSKRCLEVCDRLGVRDQMVEKGVTWQVGRIFLEDQQILDFDLLPERGHKNPAFINLQQYYMEAWLVERALQLDNIDIRWRNKVTDTRVTDDCATLEIDTPDGGYQLEAEYLLACDGARSSIRDFLGMEFDGQVFEDRFLIVDVKMNADFPSERWFWFDPPFHKNRSTLLHRQPDNVWRIDFALGPDADQAEEEKLENVMPRLHAMLGEDIDLEIEWISCYAFQCRRMEQFVNGRVIFAGDSAHQVSPFGARGANSGVEDAQNIAWKLELILKGHAEPSLIETYSREREMAADENLGHSTRSTDFIAPDFAVAKAFRNAALNLATVAPFAKSVVNTGRLSVPSVYDTPLTTPDTDDFGGVTQLGAVLPDAPMKDADGKDVWLLDCLDSGFTALYVPKNGEAPPKIEGVRTLVIGSDIRDAEGIFTTRYDARPGNYYLSRPDQYLCARFHEPDPAQIAAALKRARGQVA